MRMIVFSRGPALYSTRRLVEAGRERGHDMEVIDHARCTPALEGVHSSLLYDGKPLPLPDVAIPRIGANITARGVALIRQLDSLEIAHTLKAEALMLARDKMSCLQCLHLAGLPVPDTVLCFGLDDARRAAMRMGPYPIVIKLLESTHGVGVALVRTPYELERIADSFLRLQGRILLQRFIRESRGQDTRALVVGGRIIACMTRRAARGEFRANLHQGGTATPLTLDDDTRRLVLQAARLVGVEVAGVDFLQSSSGPLLMEVNASPGLEGIETTTGVNVARAIIQHAESKI